MKDDFQKKIFLLGGNEGKGSIRAVLNPKLKKNLNESVNKLKKYGFFVNFCEKIGIDYKNLWKYLNKHNYIPLFVLLELEKLSEIEFQKNIKYLEYGVGSSKRGAKAIKELNQDLAAMVGAFIADGHLRFRNTKRGNRYEFVFREEYKSNMDALAKWINNVFDTNITPKKEKNHYSIYISNKIIFRYFTKFFKFKSGRKTETVSIPKIIKTANNKIKIACIKGILMFDGSVSRKTGYIELYSKSKKLIIDVEKLLKDLNITPGYVCLTPDKYARYRIILRKKAELMKSLKFFEKDTRKYRRLKRMLDKVYK